MAFIHEIQIRTTGFAGAPGYTNLYFDRPSSGTDNDQFNGVKAFCGGLASLFPTIWSAVIQPVGRVLEVSTGTLSEFTTAPGSATSATAGTAGSVFGAGVAGQTIQWLTQTVVNARVVRGRTFLVPLAATAYGATGGIYGAFIADSQAAADALIADDIGFGIWHRPVDSVNGQLCPVTAAHVSTNVAFLTSRRT